jgi:cytochrome c oxidase subunit 4
MTSTIAYAMIFVVLFVVATVQVAIERLGYLDIEGTITLLGMSLTSWQVYVVGVGVIIVLSFVKAGFVAGWFMHLREEPRSVTYLALTGLAAAVALTVAAAYSIT